MLSLVERACSMRVGHRAELKLSHHLPNWWHKYVQPFPRLLSNFFFDNWKWNFGTSKLARSNRRTKQRFVNISGAIIYVIKMWAEVKILISFPMRWVESHITLKIKFVLENWKWYLGNYWILRKQLEHSRSVGRNTRRSRVFLPTLISCSSRFLRALQRNRAQSRLLYSLINM